MSADQVIAEIGKEHALKHTDTVDKSGPKIESMCLPIENKQPNFCNLRVLKTLF